METLTQWWKGWDGSILLGPSEVEEMSIHLAFSKQSWLFLNTIDDLPINHGEMFHNASKLLPSGELT